MAFVNGTAGNAGGLGGPERHAHSAALSASVRIVYDTSTGDLWYDADGSGSGRAAARQFANLDPTASRAC